MNSNIYIKEIVENFICQLSKQALFIKHYDSEELNKADFIQMVPAVTSAICLYHEYQPKDMYEAYEPFLEWIRFLYNQHFKDIFTPEEFLKECQVYSLHEEVFASYIRDGVCSRKEDVMYTEINFETTNIFTDFYHILRYVASKQKLVFVLCSFHFAPKSSLQLLLHLLKKCVSNLYFIVVYNDTYYSKAYLEKDWDALISHAKDQNILYEWGRFTSDIAMNSTEDYEFHPEASHACLQKLINMYHCFAFEDMEHYINDIYSTIEHDHQMLPELETFRYLVLYTDLSLCKDDIESAIMSCKLLSNLPLTASNPRIAFEANYLSIKTQMSSSHTDTIISAYQNCIAIANQLEDDFLLFRANLLYCMAQFGGWKDLFLCDFRIPVSIELLEQCQKYGFYNHLAYLYTMGFENDEESITAIATGKQNSIYFSKGVQLAKTLGNTDFLMSAYMKNIIIYSDAGYHEYVYHMHKKRIETVKSDDKMLQAHMFLGIGYNCIILEKYETADRYFREALHNLVNEGLADDCMDALYNICMNYFVIEDYEAVIPCIELLLKMLKALGYQNIMICNNAKLYGMMAICYFHFQDYYHTYHYLGLIEVNLNQFLTDSENTDYKYWEEELFLYHYVRAILYEYEENFAACQKELDLAYNFLWLLPGTIFYTYSLYTITQGNVYKSQGKLQERQELFTQAVTYYKKQGFQKCAEKLIAIYNEQPYEKPIVAFHETDLWFDKLLSLANYVGTQNKLKYREKDIAFLTIWQENLNRTELNQDKLLENAITITQNSYSLSDVIIIRHEENHSTTLFNNSSIELSEETRTMIYNFFQEYKRGFLSSRTDKNFLQFMPIVELFGKSRVVTILGIPISDGNSFYMILSHVNAHRNFTGNRVLLTSENLATLRFAFSQLVDVLKQIAANNVIRRMNEELECMSMTDYLTGCYNRHGLSHIAERKLLSDQIKTLLFLYIYLDNFKYYNDTFGHETGDFVLVHFSQIFQSILKNEGYTIRYGGDEFVLVVPNENEAYGLQIASKIYAQVEDGFAEAISLRSGKPVTIPSSKRLSCSIGITSRHVQSQADIELALNNADEALYFIKRNSKGHAMTWSKLQEFVTPIEQ